MLVSLKCLKHTSGKLRTSRRKTLNILHPSTTSPNVMYTLYNRDNNCTWMQRTLCRLHATQSSPSREQQTYTRSRLSAKDARWHQGSHTNDRTVLSGDWIPGALWSPGVNPSKTKKFQTIKQQCFNLQIIFLSLNSLKKSCPYNLFHDSTLQAIRYIQGGIVIDKTLCLYIAYLSCLVTVSIICKKTKKSVYIRIKKKKRLCIGACGRLYFQSWEISRGQHGQQSKF